MVATSWSARGREVNPRALGAAAIDVHVCNRAVLWPREALAAGHEVVKVLHAVQLSLDPIGRHWCGARVGGARHRLVLIRSSGSVEIPEAHPLDGTRRRVALRTTKRVVSELVSRDKARSEKIRSAATARSNEVATTHLDAAQVARAVPKDALILTAGEDLLALHTRGRTTARC